MSRRLISATLLGLMLTVVRASSAVADHGGLLEEGNLSAGSVLWALITSFVIGIVCYALMVWDPKGVRQ